MTPKSRVSKETADDEEEEKAFVHSFQMLAGH
jgi:hypothetical protein